MKKPEFKDNGILFLCSGSIVNIYKTVRENNIKNESTILVVKREENDEDNNNGNMGEGNNLLTNGLQHNYNQNGNDNNKLKKLKIYNNNSDYNMTIQFISGDQSINYFIPCKKEDILCIIVVRMLEIYPEYKKKQMFFLYNGSRLNDYLSLEENKVKDNSVIFILFNDEE